MSDDGNLMESISSRLRLTDQVLDQQTTMCFVIRALLASLLETGSLEDPALGFVRR